MCEIVNPNKVDKFFNKREQFLDLIKWPFKATCWDLWEAFAAAPGELLVDLGSDQTSLHNPLGGGYAPAGLTFDAGRAQMSLSGFCEGDPDDYLHPAGHEHLRAPRRRDCPGCNPPVHGEVVLVGGGR